MILQRNKEKRKKTKQNYPGFEFKSRQVNDSSQSNQEIDHLISHKIISTFAKMLLPIQRFWPSKCQPPSTFQNNNNETW
jgi:hypothetical protein